MSIKRFNIKDLPIKELTTVIFNKSIVTAGNNIDRKVLAFRESSIENSITLMFEHFFPTTDTSKGGCAIPLTEEDEDAILQYLLKRKAERITLNK